MLCRKQRVADAEPLEIGMEQHRGQRVVREQVVMAGNDRLDLEFLGHAGGFGRAHVAESSVDHGCHQVGLVWPNRVDDNVVIPGVACEIQAGAIRDFHEITDVGEVVAAERDGEGGLDGEIAEGVTLIGPDRKNFRCRHTEGLKFVHGFHRCHIRTFSASRAVSFKRLGIKVVAVRVGKQIGINQSCKFGGRERGGNHAVEIKAMRVPNRLAAIAEVGIECEDDTAWRFDDEAGLAKPPEADGSLAYVGGLDFLESLHERRGVLFIVIETRHQRA